MAFKLHRSDLILQVKGRSDGAFFEFNATFSNNRTLPKELNKTSEKLAKGKNWSLRENLLINQHNLSYSFSAPQFLFLRKF